jgi:hypothetical protein
LKETKVLHKYLPWTRISVNRNPQFAPDSGPNDVILASFYDVTSLLLIRSRYGKFSLTGPMGSTLNTKSLQHVQGTDDAV